MYLNGLEPLISLDTTHIGAECKDDKECHQKDPNSQCLTLDQHVLCACKINYHLDLINNTGKCVYGDPPEEDREGLTAAPIILCFMGCVIVEAFCLLAFRYWKKHRSTEFGRHHTLRLHTISVTESQFYQAGRGHVVSFMITPELESVVSDIRASSPPSYSHITVGPSVNIQEEEPPPAYEEAVKLNNNKECTNRCHEFDERRKMSC